MRALLLASCLFSSTVGAAGLQGGGLTGGGNCSSSSAACNVLTVSAGDAGFNNIQANAITLLNAAGGYDISIPAGTYIGLDGTGSPTVPPNTFIESSGTVINFGAGGAGTVASISNAGLVSATGAFSSTTAAGNNGLVFTVAGARVNLNNSADYFSDNTGGLAKFNAGLFSLQPRKLATYQIALSADTTFTAASLPAPTIIANGGVCTPAADTSSDTAFQLINYPTDGTVAHACGISGPFTTAISPTFLPVFTAVVRSDASAVTNTRVYIGLAKSDLSAVATLVGANGINGCYFRYDSGLSDTTLIAESSDGTTASATDTTITYGTATTFKLAIDNSVSGECDFLVNGVVKVAKSSNITTASQALGIEASITNITSGSVRALRISKIAVQEN